MKRLNFRFGFSIKIIKIFFVILFFSHLTFGQTEKYKNTYGVQISTGLAKVNSRSLNKIMEEGKKYDPFLTTSGSHSGLGALEGTGAYYVYSLTSKYSILGEISFNHMNSQLFINQIRDSVDTNGNGIRERSSSKGKLSMFYLSAKVFFRYYLSEEKNYFLLAGPGITFSAHPRFKSNEQYVYNVIDNNIVASADINNANQKVILNKYKIAQFNFSLGIEKEKNKVTIGIMYTYPLSKSNLYTTNKSFYTNSFSNQVFSSEGKTEAEANSNSSYHLNNFKFSTITFTIKYRLSRGKYG
jgi:hypothetical protein